MAALLLAVPTLALADEGRVCVDPRVAEAAAAIIAKAPVPLEVSFPVYQALLQALEAAKKAEAKK